MAEPSVESAKVIFVATVANHLRAFHLQWVKHLRQSGLRVCGVASDITGSRECEAAFDQVVDIPFSRSVFSLKQALLSGHQLRELRRRLGARLVHFHTPNAAFWGRLALRNEVRGGECRVAYTAHGFHFHSGANGFANRIYRSAERLAARYTHALLTINCEDAAEASRFRLAPGGFHEQLPGAGVDVTRFDPCMYDRMACRSEILGSLGVPAHSKMILMVAEFSPGKRHRDALRAFASGNLPDAHLLFAGKGAAEGRMRRVAYDLGIGQRVHFLGHRTDIPQLLATSDVVILPSEREGLPMSIMEAMAMQKPVVVANARGSRDLVQPDCGWLHEIGDSQRLASLLHQILNSPKEAADAGRKAREKVLAKYAWPVVRRRLAAVYQRLGVAVNPEKTGAIAGSARHVLSVVKKVPATKERVEKAILAAS